MQCIVHLSCKFFTCVNVKSGVPLCVHILWERMMLNSHPVHADAGSAVRITLGVCTYERPQLLAECLSSLTQLTAPYDTAVSIVVVDNEAAIETQRLVEAFADRSNHPMRYVAEPRRGIASARNRIIGEALAQNADWIVMLDDDQVVPPDWLRNMWIAQARGGADVVKSSVLYQHPDPLPRWVFPRQKPFRGRLDLKTTQTNGVLFRASLVRPAARDGRTLGMRFDETFNLSSGEDRDFFARAYGAGAYMIETPLAVATEFVPLSKCSFSAQVARVYWQEVTNARQDRRFYGVLPAMFFKSIRCVKHLAVGLALAVLAPLAIPVAPRFGRRHFLRGATKLARAAGICVGIAGTATPQPYLTIHGS